MHDALIRIVGASSSLSFHTTIPSALSSSAVVVVVLVVVVLLLVFVLGALVLLPDFGFNAPLTLIAITYFLMHVYSGLIRWRLRYKGLESDGHPLVQKLSRLQWLWKVVPVAAASGLEVSTPHLLT